MIISDQNSHSGNNPIADDFQNNLISNISNSETQNLPLSKTAAGKPLFGIGKSISIDWLSLGCVRQNEPSKVYFRDKQKYGTKIFKSVEYYSIDKIPIMVVASEPRSTALKPDLVLVKFENHLFYTDYFKDKCLEYLELAGLEVRRINRLDIALDFTKFDNNLTPDLFLQRFNNNYYIDAKYHKYSEDGNTGKTLWIQTLRLGGKTAKISAYLYNKTLEMKEKGDKPHISHFWTANGLDFMRNIWRLEISFKGNLTEVLNELTGEVVFPTVSDILNYDFLKLLFMAAMRQHFSFKIANGKTRKNRLKYLVLFADLTQFTHKTIKKEYEVGSNRSQKTALKQLVNHYAEMRETKNDLAGITEKVIEEFAIKSRLVQYLYEKTEWLTLQGY